MDQTLGTEHVLIILGVVAVALTIVVVVALRITGPARRGRSRRRRRRSRPMIELIKEKGEAAPDQPPSP
jgi:threonine/homoserine/homoserine lactone efflux protein